MRKILTILLALGTTTPVSSNMIACNNTTNETLKYEIDNKGEIIFHFKKNKYT